MKRCTYCLKYKNESDFNKCISNKDGLQSRCRICHNELKKEFIKNNPHALSKSIIQYDLEGNFIREWPSASEASRQLNIGISEISRMCLKRRNIKSVGGFKWEYTED